jgi:hypothetical protein
MTIIGSTGAIRTIMAPDLPETRRVARSTVKLEESESPLNDSADHEAVNEATAVPQPPTLSKASKKGPARMSALVVLGASRSLAAQKSCNARPGSF